nr:hypothetical protein [Tanacetum cinerariifolium]
MTLGRVVWNYTWRIGRTILDSVLNGPLVWPNVVQKDGTTRKKMYEELSATEKIQANCDLKATNIVLQGLASDVYDIVNHHKVSKEIWDRVKLLMKVLSFDGPEPQLLLSSPSLDVSLGDVIGSEPPIKPHSPDSSRMKVVDYLTTQTLPSPHMENSHPKGVYSYYNPSIDDPKRHYRFKPGLLGKSVSLGIDISDWEMFDDDWRLESKEVSPLGEELSLFDRPNKVERGRILEAHSLESIIQQQISQRMAHSHHDGMYHYYHMHLNSSVGEPSCGDHYRLI